MVVDDIVAVAVVAVVEVVGSAAAVALAFQ